MFYGCQLVLQSPNGNSSWLFNFPTVSNPVSSINLTLVDSLVYPELENVATSGATYRPTITQLIPELPPDAPTPTTTSFGDLITNNQIDGVWKIWANDDDIDGFYSGGSINSVTLNFTLYNSSEIENISVTNGTVQNLNCGTGTINTFISNGDTYLNNVTIQAANVNDITSTNATITTISSTTTTSKTLDVQQSIRESGNFVTVGQGGGSVGRSSNGGYWDSYNVFSTGGYGVAWNGLSGIPGCLYIAVGDGDTTTLAASPDGDYWTSLGNTFFTNGRAVAYNGTMWVAVGKGVNYNICYSYDGINWFNGLDSDPSTPAFTDGKGLCVAYIKDTW